MYVCSPVLQMFGLCKRKMSRHCYTLGVAVVIVSIAAVLYSVCRSFINIVYNIRSRQDLDHFMVILVLCFVEKDNHQNVVSSCSSVVFIVGPRGSGHRLQSLHWYCTIKCSFSFLQVHYDIIYLIAFDLIVCLSVCLSVNSNLVSNLGSVECTQLIMGMHIPWVRRH